MAMTVIILIICFLVWYFAITETERKRGSPALYILPLNSREKVNVNKRMIPQKIFYFSRQPYREMDGTNMEGSDKTLMFKCITYGEMLDKAEEQECLLFRFMNLDKEGIRITGFWYGDGTFGETDKKVVPEFIDAGEFYCFVCPASEAPSGVCGEYLTYPIRYKTEDRRGWVKANVRKYKNIKNPL